MRSELGTAQPQLVNLLSQQSVNIENRYFDYVHQGHLDSGSFYKGDGLRKLVQQPATERVNISETIHPTPF